MGYKSGLDSWMNIVLIATFHLVRFKFRLHWEPTHSSISMLQRKEASCREWKSIIVLGGGGRIVELSRKWALSTQKGKMSQHFCRSL